MSEIIALSGSPSKNSRSAFVLKYIGSLLIEKGFTVTYLSIRDLPTEVLFNGEYNHPTVKNIATLMKEADGVIVGTPVYKASYSGVLKTLLDILPQDILEDTPVLPLMTGGSSSHLLAMEYALKPLLATLKGLNLKGVYLEDSQIDKNNPMSPVADPKTLERIGKQVAYFTKIINKKKKVLY